MKVFLGSFGKLFVEIFGCFNFYEWYGVFDVTSVFSEDVKVTAMMDIFNSLEDFCVFVRKMG